MMTIQTQTPAPQGRTRTARAAPTPDSLDSAGLKPRPRTKDKGTFCLFCLQWRNKITKENAAPIFKALVSPESGLESSLCCMDVAEGDEMVVLS